MKFRSLIVFLILYSNHALLSQTEVTGVVTDATGATLRKARVMLVDLTTLSSQKAIVGSDGTFQFRAKAGEYAVLVAGPADIACFKPAMRQVQVAEGKNLSLRIPLLLDTNKCPEIVE